MIVRGLLLLVLLLSTACGSRFDKMSCPGNPFPESATVLTLAPFKVLTYFKGNSNDRGQIDFEVWADKKFEFDASLQYHYDKQRSGTQNCPCAVSLLVRHPLSKEREELGRSFIALLGSSLSSDLTVLKLKSVHSEFVHSTRSGSVSVALNSDIIGEISLLRHVNRGDFLQIGFYRRDYYNFHLRVPGQ